MSILICENGLDLIVPSGKLPAEEVHGACEQNKQVA